MLLTRWQVISYTAKCWEGRRELRVHRALPSPGKQCSVIMVTVISTIVQGKDSVLLTPRWENWVSEHPEKVQGHPTGESRAGTLAQVFPPRRPSSLLWLPFWATSLKFPDLITTHSPSMADWQCLQPLPEPGWEASPSRPCVASAEGQRGLSHLPSSYCHGNGSHTRLLRPGRQQSPDSTAGQALLPRG